MRGSRVLGWMMSVILLMTTAPAAHSQSSDPLVEIRRLYLDAVERESAIDVGLAVIRETGAGGETGSVVPAPLLDAYHGALVTLRAKHGIWPPSRLKHMRDGLAVLDASVAAAPNQPEIRYLRLMSCYYLPGILGRNWSVAADFEALARLLPAARADYPPDLYEEIVGFVLDNGEIDPRDRMLLHAALGQAANE